ncbi:MAG TPA: helix-turn-helix domain-containing protein [Kofleriaceae bacterium]|nr:helix-turn-helix domain-containing protein [Kofleriaceae bacterium]
MERRSERSDSPRTETVVDARTSLALWLRAGRTHRGMSLDDVAKVTKIQPRILQRLEAGTLDGLPAEVFVRGFVRSFARCVGLDEGEALRRYAACGLSGSAELTPTVRALVEAMVDLAPGGAAAPRATPRRMDAMSAAQAIEVVDVEAMRDRAAACTETRPLDARPAPEAPAAGAVVETMMLPETGTLVVPAPRHASIAEAMTEAVTEAVTDATTGADVVAGESPAASAVELLPAAGSVEIGSAPIVAREASTSANGSGAVAAAPREISQPPPASSSKKKRGRRKGRNKHANGAATTGGSVGISTGISRVLLATGTPAEASPVVSTPSGCEPGQPAPVASAAVDASDVHELADAREAGGRDDVAAPALVDSARPPVPLEPAGAEASREEFSAAAAAAAEAPIATATWSPKMPPIAPSVPWRRPAYASSTVTAPVPTLVIDDADPDSAERVLEERAEKHAPRRSFLPPILLDREDRFARQGGLTLAVIILLIAATLTLSYLMRRPSASGDGMTRLEAPALRATLAAR